MKRYISFIIAFIAVFLFKSEINAYTEYKVGEVVPYNGMEFYVIKNSSSEEDSVTMLKAEPLSVAEVNQYGGVGTANNHVNMYATQDTTADYYQKAYNNGGYGGMQYYSSETCKGYGTSSGCKSDYASSDIKYVVDAWKIAQVPSASEARLMKYEEFENLGYVEENVTPSDIGLVKTENTLSWVYSNNYYYWTMSPYNDSTSHVWFVYYDGNLDYDGVSVNYGRVVRPVITISKISLGDKDESITDDKNDTKQLENNTSNNKTESIINVKVANTYMKASLLIIISGFILACVSVVIYYIIKKKGSNE